jgi:hypothetical protein
MTTLRRFTCDDLFSFNNVNLDALTETYNLPFYLQYLARWPEYCQLAEGPGRQVMGYILGKAEGSGRDWHGHVTAVTVAPDFRCVFRIEGRGGGGRALHPLLLLCFGRRRAAPANSTHSRHLHHHHNQPTTYLKTQTHSKQGLAARLMALLEETTASVHDAFFVDLFVRASNRVRVSVVCGACIVKQ